MKWLQISVLMFGAATLSCMAQVKARDGRLDLSRAEVQQFVEEMVSEGFVQTDLEKVLREATYQASIIKAISKPAERVLTWKEYQEIFLTERRVEQGVAFMTEHQAVFDRVERKYGVDRWVILAILGVETSYGRITGSYRVIDALTTLAFDYPPRSRFFRGQLKALFTLAQEQKQDILSLKGSYAGAMGYGQFIPSSYRAYAVDADGNGFADIWQSPEDIIASVANYFAKHGWRPGLVPLIPLDAPPETQLALFDNELKPQHRLEALRDSGLQFPGGLRDEELVTLLVYAGKAGEEYWAGSQNFYAITRYNHSKLYAMAVFQLSEWLRARGAESLAS